MFSITRLNIQWGTRSATCEKMGHFRAHCPFRSRKGPFSSYNGRCVEQDGILQERRNWALARYTTISFKFYSTPLVNERNCILRFDHYSIITVNFQFFNFYILNAGYKISTLKRAALTFYDYVTS